MFYLIQGNPPVFPVSDGGPSWTRYQWRRRRWSQPNDIGRQPDRSTIALPVRSSSGGTDEAAMRSDKIADLHELGFADPVKMVTSFPEIGGLAIDWHRQHPWQDHRPARACGNLSRRVNGTGVPAGSSPERPPGFKKLPGGFSVSEDWSNETRWNEGCRSAAGRECSG